MRPLSQSEAGMSVAAPVLVGIVMVLTWEIACRQFQVPVFLFPKPSDIAHTLTREWPSLTRALAMTLRIAFQAFGMAVIIGTLIAFLFVQSRAIERSFFPMRCCCRSRPLSPLRR
jgi:NitT/TauT family transport system permease protein